MFSYIIKIEHLLKTLNRLGIKYRVTESGVRTKFYTVTYTNKGKVFSADFYAGGSLIGIWGNKAEKNYKKVA